MRIFLLSSFEIDWLSNLTTKYPIKNPKPMKDRILNPKLSGFLFIKSTIAAPIPTKPNNHTITTG